MRRPAMPNAVICLDSTAYSWQELFTEFAPPIRSFAVSRGVPNPDDVVQEVFAAAVERLPDFVGDRAGLRSLLFTIAYRRIADVHRSANRRREDLVADHTAMTDETSNVEDAVTARESASEALQALTVLTDRERRVVVMRVLHGASPAEVASELGLSTGNVRVIQTRALMKVRKHMAASAGTQRTMAVAGLLIGLVEASRSRLPTHGHLGHWVATVRSDAAANPELTVVGLGAMGAAAGAAGSATGASVIGAGALQVGVVLSLAAASALGVVALSGPDDVLVRPAEVAEPIVATPAGSDQPGRGEPVQEPTPREPGIQGTPVGEPVGAHDVPATDGDGTTSRVVDDPSGTGGPIARTANEPAPRTPAPAATDDGSGPANPINPDAGAPSRGGVTSSTDDATVSVIDGVVTPLVDDVATPLVDGVVTPLVDDVVTPLVDDVATPLVDEVTRQVGDIVDQTDGVVNKVKGLVGRLGG